MGGTEGPEMRIKSIQFGNYLMASDAITLGGYLKRRVFFAPLHNDPCELPGEQKSLLLIEMANNEGVAPRIPSVEQLVGSEADSTPGSENVVQHPESHLKHFKQQVVNDFETVRGEVKDSFECVFGPQSALHSSGTPDDETSTTSTVNGEVVRTSGSTVAEQYEEHEQRREQQQPEQQPTFKRTVPEVASALVGATVASTLLPLRMLRLAVASVAELTSDHVASGDQTDPTASPTVISPGQLEEDITATAIEPEA